MTTAAQKIPVGYKQAEIGVIPNDWLCLQIPELTARTVNPIKIGPFGSALKKEYLTKEGYKVYGQENVYERDMSIGDRFLCTDHFKKLKSCEIVPGDFLISMMGTVGECMIVPKDIDTGIMDSHLLRIRFNAAKVHTAYIDQLFRTIIVSDQIKQLSVGGIMEGLSSKIIKSIFIPLPSTKEEQSAITTTLSDADALIKKTEKLIEKKKNIKHGAMQELLTGKRRLPGFSDKWEVKKMRGVANIIRGASPRPIESPVWFDEKSNIGWVRISDVTKSTKLLKHTTQKLSELGIKHSRFVGKGNLIMSICATIGRPILTDIDICIHDGFVVFSDSKIEKEYFYYYLLFIEDDWSKNGQTGSQMNLNTVLINSTQISFPKSKTEQLAIAVILSDMDSEIEKLESQLTKYKNIKQGMMQNLLTGKIRLIKK
jgi:type I restriction enzyme S subunit